MIPEIKSSMAMHEETEESRWDRPSDDGQEDDRQERPDEPADEFEHDDSRAALAKLGHTEGRFGPSSTSRVVRARTRSAIDGRTPASVRVRMMDSTR